MAIPFSVNCKGSTAMYIDSDGNTVVNKLVLFDEKTGNKWEVKVSDGEIVLQPLDKQDIRDLLIKKIIE